MKEQLFLSASNLKAKFSQERETTWVETGMAGAIEALSKALSDLRDIGVDAELQLNGIIAEDSFPLIQKVSEIKTTFSVAASGILKVGPSESLLAISTSEDKKPVLKIYVSDRDYAARSLRHDFRGSCFDLNADAEALQKFQAQILRIAAQNEIIREHDVADTLGFDGRRKFRLSKTIPIRP